MTDYEKPPYYTYYDTPDGCDILKKILVTSRYGFITGCIFSTYDVLMYTHAVRTRHILKRYAYHTLPLTLMGTTFAVVANGLVHIRDKDDCWNYVGGALASAPIFGWYLRSKHAWFLGSIGLSIIAAFKKDSVDNCWVFFPEKVPHSTCSLYTKYTDYTILKDIKIYPDVPADSKLSNVDEDGCACEP